MSEKRDLSGRGDIEQVVDAFYEKVRGDELLGFIFDDVAKTNWETHLPKMYGFWETVLFGTGSYAGNPLAAHAKLVPLTAMGREQFDRWLALFEATVDGLFEGDKAGHLKRSAADMANVIHAKINGLDLAKEQAALSEEQRARYAKYREGKGNDEVAKNPNTRGVTKSE